MGPQGLIDMLLQGTRFDSRTTNANRMEAAGLDPNTGSIPQVQPQVQPTQSQYGNSVEQQIRARREARKVQQQQEAMRFLQTNGGQVLPQR